MTHRDIRPLRDIVREHILTALELSHWRTGRAALALGITQRHIYNKIREYGIDLEETRKQAKLKLTGKSF